jgi:putative ABC transport system substrate-binding protein
MIRCESATPGVLAVKLAITTIPIVMAASADAVATGLVSSLSRPGGNVTGLTFFNPELAAKRLELLKEVVPSMTRAAVLMNPDNSSNGPILHAMIVTAKNLYVDVQPLEARGPGEFDTIFSLIADKQIGALVIQDNPVLIFSAKAIADLALRHQLPASGFPEFAMAGGLMAYGVDFNDMYPRAATFVDKILKGTKPADLPVEQPTRFDLVINLKTAKALGLTVPPSLLTSADEVIE